jgi:hypothetical protein
VFALPAQAASPPDGVVAALKSSSVYVAPGTENTNSETAGKLQEQLTSGDNIAIVILPATAGEPASLAQAIDKATRGKYIIGLSVGEQVVAASTIMPQNVATNLVNRAAHVSSSPLETLETFIRDVHKWQGEHPHEAASKPVGKKSSGSPVVTLVLLIFAMVLGGIVIAIAIANKRRQADDGLTFRSSPSEVRDLLHVIMEQRPAINNDELSSIVKTACEDTEQYFQRSGNPEDSDEFVHHLQSVRSILKQYIDIQNNQRYYDNPQALMKQGLEAIKGFASFVQDSIRRGRRADLTNFKVDTDILSAQRYR